MVFIIYVQHSKGRILKRIIAEMEEDALNVLKFMASNGLVANPKKTTLIFLNCKSSTNPISINIGNEKITQEKSAKLLGMSLDDNQQWKSHISGSGGVIPNLNKRLYTLRRLRNHVNEECLKKVANSIYTSKIRYGLQLCGKVRSQPEDTTVKVMKELQKTQNKMLRFLNKTKISDKIKTELILDKFNMLSVNQLNTQIKLTETWKAVNDVKSSLNNLKKKKFEADRTSRSVTNGDLLEEGSTIIALNTYQNDATRIWNKAPISIKSSLSLYLAKKEIKKFFKNTTYLVSKLYFS